MRRAAAVSLVLIAILVGSLLAAAGPVTAQDGNESDTAAAEAPEWSLEELKANGDRPENAPASVRASGSYSEYALKYLPTGLMVDDSDDSGSWRYLGSGTTVQRDEVQVWSKRGYEEPEKDVSIRIAYWTQGEEEVTNGNTTTTEQVPQNVTTKTIDASVASGYDVIDVPLKSHFDEPTEVTMCVQEEGDGNCLKDSESTRWRFTHHTSAAAQAISYDTAGGQIAWAIGLLVLPFALFTAGSLYVSRKAIRAARAGPNISMLVWVIALGGIGMGTLMFWDQVIATLVSAPWVLSILAGCFLGILASEWFGDQSYMALFFRLRFKDVVDHEAYGYAGDQGDGSGEVDLEDVDEPDGDDSEVVDVDGASGKLVADAIPLRLARGEEGGRSRIGRGFWSFLARWRGARADLEAQDGRVRTHVDIEAGPYEELYVLDAEDDVPLEYEPESHRFEFPELVSRDEHGNVDVNFRSIIGGLFVLATSWLAGKVLLASAPLGLLIGAALLFIVKIAQPDQGYLRAHLAPVHYGNAMATMFQHAKRIGDAGSWEQLFDELSTEKAENRAERQQLQDRKTTSQTEEIVNEFVGDDPGPEEAPSDD